MIWLRAPWTVSFPCVAAVAKLSKWVSKSSSKFVPSGRTQVSTWIGAWLVAGLMLWMSWAAAAAPKESYPLDKRVLSLRFLCRGLKVYFQAFHVWSAFVFPFHSGWSLGNEMARRREDMANAASQLLVIGRPTRLDFFCTSSIVMMNRGTRGLLDHYPGSSPMRVMMSVTSRPPFYLAKWARSLSGDTIL